MALNTQPKILALFLSGLVLYSTAQADSSKPSGKDDAVLDTVEVIAKPLSKDEKGEAQVYSKNVSNVYVGKEYLERYRVDSAGDILKGLNGVYNMNTRTAGSSITPNIRGIAGKGRIPVTIDGTEQTVDVWLNNYGVGDRNYVDPALFRSIAVEKSPSMTRGVKSGVGGAMSIRTIEADDIVPKGKKWGIELRTSFSGNSTENKNDLRKYMGMDYRKIPGGATADGSGGGFDPFSYKRSPMSLLLDKAEEPKHKTTSDNFKFNGDQSYLISGAFKTDLTDGLIAYSYRKKGNYFAGKHGAEGYLHNPLFSYEKCSPDNPNYGTECRYEETFIPNMAKMYSAGEEVFNSNVQTKTLLAKNNWHLPNHQKIGFQYMKTNILFGEINPYLTSYILDYTEVMEKYAKSSPPPQSIGISSEIETQTKKISYEWKPENNRWIDFSANAWQVKTKSERHQTGALPLVVNFPDSTYDHWRWCTVRGQLPRGYSDGSSPWIKTCDDLSKQDENFRGFNWKGMTEDEVIKHSDNNQPKPNYLPLDPEKLISMLGMTREKMVQALASQGIKPEDVDSYLLTMAKQNNQKEYERASNKRYEVISGAVQATEISRTGFDISNRFRLRDNLTMTVSADYQREKLKEYSKIINSNDLFNSYGIVTGMAAMAGPRSAERREWGSNISFDWSPTDKLDIQAGIRYHNFRGRDIALEQARKNRDKRYAVGGYDGSEYVDGFNIPYHELLSDAEAQDYKKIEDLNERWNKLVQTHGFYDPETQRVALESAKAEREHGKKYGYDKYSSHHGDVYDMRIERVDAFGHRDQQNGALYRIRSLYLPFHNKKLDSSIIDNTFTAGFFDKKINNAQGLNNAYYQHLITPAFQRANGGGSGEKSYLKYKYENTHGLIGSGAASGITPHQAYYHDIHQNGDGKQNFAYVLRNYTDEEKWQLPSALSHHAWSPMLAITYRFTENQKIFARYAQATRFPSLYEIAAQNEGIAKFSRPIKPGFDLKPERSINWEVGYGFNFAPYWSKLRHGDVRITYYNNTIKNVIDTTDEFNIYQYDKKITKGLELQSRIDTGKYFASFGATYRLAQTMCDSQVSFIHDMYLHRAPQCVEGSFGKTRFQQALQPKYSLNLDVGTRLLGEKLELGMRGVYHSKVDNQGYGKLLKGGFTAMLTYTGKPYNWRSSLVWDMYGRYQINKNISMNFGVTNLTDRYYLDPMSSIAAPGPGRTFSLGIKGKF